ncbi:MAG: PH domain-containing protein [Alphaproteobacteria bacterium]|nr:PH domain-containing protein [Alphaproteobacteria bacterium]
MFSYIKKIVAPGEDVICRTKLHWIQAVWGFVWLLLFGGAALAADRAALFYLGFPLPFIPWLLLATGVVLWSVFVVSYLSSEIVLTQKRIFHKRGLLRVVLDEFAIDEVKGEHVAQSLLGHILGYGTVHVDCRLINDMEIRGVLNPYQFIEFIQVVRTNELKI